MPKGGGHSGPEGQNFGKMSYLENIFMISILAFFFENDYKYIMSALAM